MENDTTSEPLRDYHGLTARSSTTRASVCAHGSLRARVSLNSFRWATDLESLFSPLS